MNKLKIISGSVLIVALLVLTASFWRQPPSQESIPLPPPVFSDEISQPATTTNESLHLRQPATDSVVTSPLVVSGEARGRWFFEGSFPLRLEDGQGNILATALATAGGDWMTEDFVPFLAQLDFSVASDTAALLVLARDNPSGLSEHDEEIRLPLTLKSIEPDKLTLQVYFSNNQLDPEVTCQRVFPVERLVPRTEAVARAALEELLKGVSESEQAAGYLTNLNSDIVINSLTITDGTAYVDFSRQLEDGVAGSCRVGAIRAQITETLRQFDSVKEVVISVDGRTADILQP